MELDLRRLLAGELTDRSALRIVKAGRPPSPVRYGAVRPAKTLGESAISRVSLKRNPFAIDVCPVRAAALGRRGSGLKHAKELLQHSALYVHYRLVVDLRCAPKRIELADGFEILCRVPRDLRFLKLGNGLDVEVDRIAKEAARR